jgi:hypothetical protein
VLTGITHRVRLYYLPDGEGIELDFADFARRWDAFCYSSSDDCWIWQGGRPWLLEWSHEEVFRLFAHVFNAHNSPNFSP